MAYLERKRVMSKSEEGGGVVEDEEEEEVEVEVERGEEEGGMEEMKTG